MATYVISDLHGQYNIFLKLLEKAEFSDSDKLYMLGDAIDRGPDSIKILQHVMRALNMEFLLGNHEVMMLETVDREGNAPAAYSKLPDVSVRRWLLRNSGNKTYYKYKLLKKSERKELVEWLCVQPLLKTVTVGDRTFLLTHSYFDISKIDVPYDEMSREVVWDIVWKSPYREDLFVPSSEYTALSPWKVVLGHVPVSRADRNLCVLEPLFKGNIIDIDGGCAYHNKKNSSYRGGILLRLDDLQSFTCSFAELGK